MRTTPSEEPFIGDPSTTCSSALEAYKRLIVIKSYKWESKVGYGGIFELFWQVPLRHDQAW